MAKRECECKLIPLADRIVVVSDEAVTQTPGGILLPDQAQERPKRGMVVAVGSGSWNRDGTARLPMDVGMGMTVLFGSYAGSEAEIDGEKFLILSQADVLSIVVK